MKVLFVLTYYHPYWTGLSLYAKTVAEAYASQGHDVTVLTTAHIHTLPKQEVINGVKVVRSKVWLRISRTMISIQFIYELFKLISRTDSVIVFLPLAEIVLVAGLVKLFDKKLYLVHNGDLVLPKGKSKKLFEKIYYYTSDIGCRVANKIVIHTKDYASQSKLLSKYKDKWRVILTPVQSLQPNKNETQNLKLAIGARGEIVGFAGRFVEEKGFDILFNAMPLVIKKKPNIKFVFAGETQMIYEDFFEKQKTTISRLDPWLKFLGLLDRNSMASFYSLLDAFVVSSRSDCFPTTQMEAMLAGVPIVVTNIPGARWPVLQTGMGRVVAASSPEALAEGILDVLENKKKFSNAKDLAKKLFSFSKSINLYEELIKD